MSAEEKKQRIDELYERLNKLPCEKLDTAFVAVSIVVTMYESMHLFAGTSS